MYAWIVVMRPDRMPMPSWRTFATGARQFVVHEAFETIVWRCGSKSVWLTPMTNMPSTPLPGEDMTTVRAPASRWPRAWSALRNRPVASMTMSTPYSRHGISAGVEWAVARMLRPSTKSESSSWSTTASRRRHTES